MTTPEADDDVAERDETFGRLNRLTKTLRAHDERGLILSLAAFAEEALGELISAFMLPGSARDDLLSGFNAPLGTFSSRIKAGYALGLINEEQFRDLECLRKIRNEFAHSWGHLSLDQDRMAALARNMSFSYLDDEFPETNADKVRSSITALLTDISSMTHQNPINGVRAKVTGTRLIPLFAADIPTRMDKARKKLESLRSTVGLKGERRRFHAHRLALFDLQMDLLSSLVPAELRKEAAAMSAEVKSLQQSLND